MFPRIKDKYYSIKNGIWNIIRWFPVIWEDRDWDDYYIFALLYHKFCIKTFSFCLTPRKINFPILLDF